MASNDGRSLKNMVIEANLNVPWKLYGRKASFVKHLDLGHGALLFESLEIEFKPLTRQT